MKFRNVLLYNRYRNILIQETKRYAGHSKWQNIKATKQEHDNARSQIFNTLSHKMKVVALESGNPDPNTNPKLANLVAQARKANMPMSTLKGILEKIKNVRSGETHILPIRILKGPIFVIHIVTDKLTHVKFNIIHISKKFNAKVLESSAFSHWFDSVTFVIASKDCNLDSAMEDAIIANAIDVEEIKDGSETYFKFKSEFLHPEKVITQLENLGYTILSTENECIPTDTVQVTEEELLNINKFKQKLTSEIKEIVKIEDNIASL
ncbi:probable transcriptional regulatory protein Cthe_2075 [Bombus terrestris]|uniref:Probable transcriptional regulatory protein Cthe_2075 n=1 Tax=Bombus terrestris TaxID=30195 RepID=A0A9B0BT64_BOMTE|nr:probable transcriptional regulatory protein Cthe_2075 [Bombus terrestris]